MVYENGPGLVQGKQNVRTSNLTSSALSQTMLAGLQVSLKLETSSPAQLSSSSFRRHIIAYSLILAILRLRPYLGSYVCMLNVPVSSPCHLVWNPNHPWILANFPISLSPFANVPSHAMRIV